MNLSKSLESNLARGITVKQPGFAEWRIVILLVISVVINYIDRGGISISAPALSKELSLSPAQLGLLLSAFFWSYAASLIPAGWLADRYSVGIVLASGYLLWSLSTFSTGFIHGMGALMTCQIMLGLGQSVAFPSYSHIIVNRFAVNQRGLPNAMIDAGTKIGPALGMLFGGLLIAHSGWRTLFWLMGAGGLLWLVPWMAWAPRRRRVFEETHLDADKAGPGFREILRQREAWGTILGNSCGNYAYFFLWTWLPSYLVMDRHLSLEQMAIFSSLPFWGCAITSLAGGWLSDRWITRGGNPTRVRKTFVVTGLLMFSLVLPAGIIRDFRVSIALLMVAYLAYGLFSSNHWAISQTLAGPLASGRWTGLQNAIGNISAIVAPALTGLIVLKTSSFVLAFLVAGFFAAAGAASYLFVVRQVAPIVWSRRASR